MTDGMRWARLIALWIVPIIAITLPSGVAAEDFTLTVPVKLQKLDPKVKNIYLRCYVTQGLQQRWPFREASIGEGEPTRVQVPASGELSQDVVIKFNALSEKDPSAATHYYCDLMFWMDVVGGTSGRVPTERPTTGYEWTRVQPGFVIPVTGLLRPTP